MQPNDMSDWRGQSLISVATQRRPHGVKRRLTADDYRRSHDEGLTVDEAVKRLGVTRSTVTAAAERLGLENWMGPE